MDNEILIDSLLRIRMRLTQLYTIWGISRAEAEHANIEKLGERYSSGSYSNNQAQTRADKLGGKADNNIS